MPVVTASEDNTARLWDAAAGKEIAVLRGHENSVWSAAFSPEWTRVVTASETVHRRFRQDGGEERRWPVAVARGRS